GTQVRGSRSRYAAVPIVAVAWFRRLPSQNHIHLPATGLRAECPRRCAKETSVAEEISASVFLGAARTMRPHGQSRSASASYPWQEWPDARSPPRQIRALCARLLRPPC